MNPKLIQLLAAALSLSENGARSPADALGDQIANRPWDAHNMPPEAKPTMTKGLDEIMKIGVDNIDALVLTARIREPRDPKELEACPGCGEKHDLVGGNDPNFRNNVFSVMVGGTEMTAALLEYLRLEHAALNQ